MREMDAKARRMQAIPKVSAEHCGAEAQDSSAVPDPAMATGTGSPEARSPRRWAPWTELLADIAGAVLRRLSLTDRKAWNGVCSSWRELARLSHPIPRLPVLVLSNLSCSSLSLSGGMTPVQKIDFPVSVKNCIGCYEDWVLILSYDADTSNPEYLLLNPFTKMWWSFPQPPASSEENPLQLPLRKYILIQNTPFFARLSVCQTGEGTLPGIQPVDKVVFSSKPYPGSTFIAAAAKPDSLMFCHVSMWYACTCEMFKGPKDMLFLGERLLVLMSSGDQMFTFTFQLKDDSLAVTLIEKIVIKIPVLPNRKITRNIIQWQGSLLLVMRSSLRTNTWNDVQNVSVFQANIAAAPTEYLHLTSLKGNNIFISPTSSKVFPAESYAEIEGNTIFSVDSELELLVFKYGISDAATALLPVNIPAPDLLAARKNILWLFRE